MIIVTIVDIYKAQDRSPEGVRALWWYQVTSLFSVVKRHEMHCLR